jgi:hypothetical protein
VYLAEEIIINWILILKDGSSVVGLPDTGQVAIEPEDRELHVSLLAQDLRRTRYPPVELVERLSEFCCITNPSHILLLSYILREDDTDIIKEDLQARELMARDNPGSSGDIVGESTKSDSQGDTTYHEAESTTLIKRSGKLKNMDEHRPVNEDQSDSNIVEVGDTLPIKRQTPVPRSSNFSTGAPRDTFCDQDLLKQKKLPPTALNIYNASHEVSDPELVQKNEVAPTISGAVIDSQTRSKTPSGPQKLTSTTRKPTKPAETDYGNPTTSYLLVTQAPQDESSGTQSTSRGHERRFTPRGPRTRNASTEALPPAATLNLNEFLNCFEPTSTRTFHSMRDGLVPLSTPLASFGGGDDKQTQYIGERYVGILTSALRFAGR